MAAHLSKDARVQTSRYQEKSRVIVMPYYLPDSGKIIDMPFAGVRLPARLSSQYTKKPRTYSTTVKASIVGFHCPALGKIENLARMHV
jgi:hypothetical protein